MRTDESCELTSPSAQVLAGGPVTEGLRFALAYLHSVGRGERVHYDAFWRAARREVTGNDAEDFGRRQGMNAALNGICRDVGVVRDLALEKALREARGG